MIIGFVGKMGVGKSTAADYLVEKRGFKKVNFKDGLLSELKERLPDTLSVIANENNLTVDELFTKKPYLPVIRALLQNYGTEVRRWDNPNYWVKKWKETIGSHPVNIVVDDVRFLNEAQCIVGNGGIIVRIVRDDIQDTGNHQSETESDGIVANHIFTAVKDQPEVLFERLDFILDGQQR